MLTLSLALALAAAPPDTTRDRPRAAQSAPAITVHSQPALPVVALRMSVVADDPPGYAGAGHLIQHLLLHGLEDQAARVGGRVQAIRGADAIVYTVVGPATELDYLAGILRSTLRPPAVAPGSPGMLQALGALAEERSTERETAPAYVRAALRAQLFPAGLPAAGTDGGAARLQAAALGDVWGEIYAPDRVSIVAVGDVTMNAVERAFRSLPAASAGRLAASDPDTIPAFEADTPQATRGWIGSAWRGDSVDAAAMSVTARLLRTYLRRRMSRSNVEVEHWWTHHGQALALVVATPDSLVRAARGTVGGALAAFRPTVNEEGVRAAARSLRREMLFYSRTPERMAELLGEFSDRGAGRDATQRYYAALDAVTEEDVARVLDQLAAGEPATVYVPPQRIPPEQRR